MSPIEHPPFSFLFWLKFLLNYNLSTKLSIRQLADKNLVEVLCREELMNFISPTPPTGFYHFLDIAKRTQRKPEQRSRRETDHQSTPCPSNCFNWIRRLRIISWPKTTPATIVALKKFFFILRLCHFTRHPAIVWSIFVLTFLLLLPRYIETVSEADFSKGSVPIR